MTQKSTEYYERIMDDYVLQTIKDNHGRAISSGITPEELTKAASLAEITYHHTIEVREFESMIVFSLSSLMKDYRKNTGVERHWIPKIVDGCCIPGIFDSCFGGSNHRMVLAKCVDLTVAYSMAAFNDACTHGRPLETFSFSAYINEIKRFLIKGVLDDAMQSDDNFPNMVRAIYNKTNGLPGWEWDAHDDVLSKLTELEQHQNIELQAMMTARSNSM